MSYAWTGGGSADISSGGSSSNVSGNTPAANSGSSSPGSPSDSGSSGSVGPSRQTAETRTDGDAGASITVTSDGSVTTTRASGPDDSGSSGSSSSGSPNDSGGSSSGMDPSNEFVAGLYGDTGDSETNQERSEFLNRDDVTPGDLSGEAVSQIFDATDTPVNDAVQGAQNQAEETVRTVRQAVPIPFSSGSDGSSLSDSIPLVIAAVVVAAAVAVFGSGSGSDGSGSIYGSE